MSSWCSVRRRAGRMEADIGRELSRRFRVGSSRRAAGPVHRCGSLHDESRYRTFARAAGVRERRLSVEPGCAMVARAGMTG